MKKLVRFHKTFDKVLYASAGASLSTSILNFATGNYWSASGGIFLAVVVWITANWQPDGW